MEKFSTENLKNIKSVIQRETGVDMNKVSNVKVYAVKKCAVIAACLLCFVSLSAFVSYKFNSLNGDDLALSSVYLGDGEYEIMITNLSDHELKIQDNIKVMQWSTGEPVEGNADLIQVESPVISAGSTGIVRVDLSKGYNIETMQKRLGENDWYYFILTNNNFVFGQDWMCPFGFETEDEDTALAEHKTFVEQIDEKDACTPHYEEEELIFDDWEHPAEPFTISGYFGEQANGFFSDHINVAGEEGNSIFAVYDGMIAEAGFDTVYGNYIVLSISNEVSVKYGHLKDVKAEEGEKVSKGDEIGTMGKTGMAAEPNLSFTVYLNGEAINPLVE